jgi:hypothetical protein
LTFFHTSIKYPLIPFSQSFDSFDARTSLRDGILLRYLFSDDFEYVFLSRALKRLELISSNSVRPTSVPSQDLSVYPEQRRLSDPSSLKPFPILSSALESTEHAIIEEWRQAIREDPQSFWPNPSQDYVVSAIEKSSHIRRPPNKFILFRTHIVKYKLGNNIPHQQNASKVLALVWRHALPSSIQDAWSALAASIRRKHAERYPTYKYSPNRKRKAAAKSINDQTVTLQCFKGITKQLVNPLNQEPRCETRSPALDYEHNNFVSTAPLNGSRSPAEQALVMQPAVNTAIDTERIVPTPFIVPSSFRCSTCSPAAPFLPTPPPTPEQLVRNFQECAQKASDAAVLMQRAGIPTPPHIPLLLTPPTPSMPLGSLNGSIPLFSPIEVRSVRALVESRAAELMINTF